jgi:O-Antigen ligase
MPQTLALIFAASILTLWIPAVWPVSAFQVAIGTLCILTLWRRPPARIPYPAIPLALAVFWGLIQLRFHLTAYPFDTQTALLRWAAFLAVFLTSYCLFADPDTRRWFRSFMLWFAFILSIVATLQTFTSPGKIFWIFPTEYTENVMGPILYHNHWAVFVEVVLPIALYEAFRRDRDALLYAGMAATLYASVIASASRSGTILTTAEILTVGILMTARGFSTGRAVGTAFVRMLVLFAAFTAIAGWDHIWNRFREPDPMNMRREFNIASLHIIQTHALTGTGLGTWPTIYPRYAILDGGTFANQAHDDWAQFTAEGGILFGLAIFSLFAWSIYPALKSIWGIGIIAVFLHAFVDYPFSRPALGAWPILILAMLAAQKLKPENA